MKLVFLRLLYFLMPFALVVFIFRQNIAPVLVNSNVEFVRKSAESFGVKSNETEEQLRKPASVPVNTLKTAPDGVYYAYKAEYSCYDHDKRRQIPSYFDSFRVSAGQFCQMGDACNKGPRACYRFWPSGVSVAKDFNSLNYRGRKYSKQDGPMPDSCRMPTCGEIANICRFDELPPLDESGCPQGCGTLVCKLGNPTCPLLKCAAPPENCEYDGQAPVDNNGCATGCGNLVCDSISTVEFRCPVLDCPRPPENCIYENGLLDKNGCKVSCGDLKCKSAAKNGAECKQSPQCAEPPAGCRYFGEHPKDKSGCQVGCGSIVCKKQEPEGCKPPVCDELPPNCRYDGNSPLDFNGCATGCGDPFCHAENPL